MVGAGERRKQQRRKGQRKLLDVYQDDNEGAEDDDINGNGGGGERQREHPFIVTEPGEVARGKKNGLDYLFHLYEQCRDFLIQVQNIAKERGEKCPTKVRTPSHTRIYIYIYIYTRFLSDFTHPSSASAASNTLLLHLVASGPPSPASGTLRLLDGPDKTCLLMQF